jgi:hypothetical protein
VEEIPILSREDGSHTVKQFMAQYDAPAYVRRARRVDAEWEGLLARCRRQRDEWLALVRVRLATLHALAGDWERLLPLLADAEHVESLRKLHDELRPELRLPVPPTESVRALRRAVAELIESAERFNRRWRAYLDTVDLGPANAARDGYNRWYVLEKECALRSARLARQGFRPLAPLTLDAVAAALPPLPVPRLCRP